jgi:hypothetical protein
VPLFDSRSSLHDPPPCKTLFLRLSVFDAPCSTQHSLDWMTLHHEHSVHSLAIRNIAVQSGFCSRDLFPFKIDATTLIRKSRSSHFEALYR